MQENSKEIVIKKTVRNAFGTEPIYQIDTGHVLVFDDGFDLPEFFEVHFSNSITGTSITQIGQNHVVTLPDMYAQTANPIYAWLYIDDGESGLTKFFIEIPVYRRAIPSDDEPTPVEERAIDQAIAALNEGVDRAETAADNAETAQGEAEDAQEAAEQAQSAAEQAADNAENASEAIQNMSVSASTLAPGSQATVTKVVDPEDGSVTLEFGIPEGEQGQPGEPGATPDLSVGTVSTLPAGSQATVTISGTQEAPVMNFGIPEGQPGTPGDPTTLIDDTAGAGTTNKTWSANKLTSDVLSALNQKQDAPSSPGTAGQVLGLDSTLSPAWVDQTGGDESGLAPVIKSTASGEIASFADGADGRQIDSLVVNITPVQSGSGDPSPENIRPITGWTGCEVSRTGKNLLNVSAVIADPELSGILTVDDDGWIILNGTVAEWARYVRIPATIIPGTYTMSANNTATSVEVQFSLRNADYSSNSGWNPFGTLNKVFTFEVTSTASYAQLQINPGTYTNFKIHLQLEPGSVASPYTSYTGTTLPISWQTEAGTVYGGQDEIIGGGLKAEYASYIYDGTESGWDYAGSDPTNFTVAIRQEPSLRTIGSYVLCNRLVGVASSLEATAGHINVGDGSYNVRINVGITFHSIDEWKTWLANNNLQVVAKLAEPVQYQLPGNTMTTLLGINNIWASCGSISSVVYSADTKAYVDDAIPSVPVTDVQVAGTSILVDGVANVPVAGVATPGVVKVINNYGLDMSNGYIITKPASTSEIKTLSPGTYAGYRPIVPSHQHESTFYGLAAASGDTTQASSSNAVGTYTDSAKSAIHEMLSGSVSVSGTTPTITALPGIRYVCGEVATLTVTLPASGIVDIVFESGSTATVLTITPPTGVTLKWAGGFDPSALDANTTYEINICDGLGVAASWT